MDFNFRFSNCDSKNNFFSDGIGLLSNNYDVETTGSVAFLNSNDGGFDSFGSKDFFGSVDFSNMDSQSFASAPSVETVGSIACSNFDSGVESFSSGVDCGSSFSGDFGGESSCCFIG